MWIRRGANWRLRCGCWRGKTLREFFFLAADLRATPWCRCAARSFAPWEHGKGRRAMTGETNAYSLRASELRRVFDQSFAKAYAQGVEELVSVLAFSVAANRYAVRLD